MSSTIKLYEHNQKAYDALLDMLGECDRACVIKPTGTGKFVILAKMVQDNPDKRFLLLGTNDYMFNDQMANLAEIAPGFTPENLQFMTYSAAMMTARRGEEISGYDVVVADEFHHCGAEEWGKGVTHILDANESAKVVGFSATPIRYSDGGRNMANEMFDGNVAYSMELEEAWLRGILPIPKYVTAFYEAPKELGRLAKSIAGIKDEMVMKRFQKKYENLRRSLTEAGGVREAIAKHLKKRDAKVIVFCPRVAKLREFMLLRREWFGAVNSEIHAYKTVSADPYGSEDFQAFKDDESDALKVLYCVNQLNEAVHVKGVDAIVMVRPTKSPTVFYQQLGRALSSGGNRTPLVFDFCNNFGSIVAAERIPKRMEETFKRLTGESEEKAVAAARDFISEHKNAVNDQKHGIGSVTYWVAVVERAMEDAVMGWLPCDRDGVTEDEEGMVPDDATVAYISTLDGSREERAFELAKHDYYGFLDYKEDRYTTVYGYMD